MVSTHEVNCKKCNERIAWWSMYDNISYLDEFVCTGTWKKEKLVLPGGRHVFIMDGGDGTTERYYQKHGKKEWVDTFCEIEFKTTYCGDCAEDLLYKCKVCGSALVLERLAPGSDRGIRLYATLKRSQGSYARRVLEIQNGGFFVLDEYKNLEIDRLHARYHRRELDFGSDNKNINTIMRDVLRGRRMLKRI